MLQVYDIQRRLLCLRITQKVKGRLVYPCLEVTLGELILQEQFHCNFLIKDKNIWTVLYHSFVLVTSKLFVINLVVF